MILGAARRLLLRGGREALRWDAIAAEAGRNKSAIKYCYGNKKGLVLAWSTHSTTTTAWRSPKSCRA